MLTAGLTFLGLSVGLAVGHALGVRGLAARALFAGTLVSAEIVASALVLGVTGWLTRPALVAVSGSVSALGLALVLRGGGTRFRAWLAADAAALRGALRELCRPANAVLATVATVAWLWVLAAIVYLPPRSVDDLNYHLPPMLEAIVRRGFVLLPLDLRPWLAYPLGADLLFLWPTLLRGDLAWTDGVQATMAALAALGVVALARELGASRGAALFGALLFLVVPVTLKQATSCYTDVTVAAFYAAALFGAVRHARDGSPSTLLFCGIASGLLAGTKYHFLFPLLALVPLTFFGLRHASSRALAARRALLLFVLPAVALGSYWYVRNLLLLGNPVYPYRLGLGSWTLFPSVLPANEAAVSPAFVRSLFQDPALPFTVSLRDVGVGGPDGGLGPLFWGAVIPLGVLHAVRGLRRPTLAAGVGLQLLATLVPYLAAPFDLFEVSPRYFITTAVPGFALLAWSLETVRRRWPAPGMLATALAVLAAALAVTPIAPAEERFSRKQLMRFDEAAAARVPTSPWHFIRDAAYGVGDIAPAYELLDALGAPSRPLWVYATGPYPGGFYGTFVQNRIWNFGSSDRPANPDALAYFLENRRPDGIFYYGTPGYRWAAVLDHPERWDPLVLSAEAAVFVRRDLIAPGAALRERLAEYLERTYADAVAAAANLAPRPDRGTIVAVGPTGLGLKALELRGVLPTRVVTARTEDGLRVAAHIRDGQPVYVATRAGLQIGRVAASNGDYSLYEVTP